MTPKHLIFTIGLFILSIGIIKAQDNLTINLDSVYSRVDVLPEFPGGMKELGKYVDGKGNHNYPKEARKNKIEGKVIVQFIINADGTASDFKVIQSIGYGCDEAAVEAFKKMPKWKPATINGQPVRFLTQMGYLYGL
jgi:periplasmic protein TonB